MTDQIRCSHCGELHDIGEIEASFELPDAYFELSDEERESRGILKGDFCQLDERYFIRSLIPVPVLGQEDEYCWGVWVELSKSDFLIAWDNYDEEDVSSIQKMEATLANDVFEYEGSLGLEGDFQLNPDMRPFFFITQESRFKDDQLNGITLEDTIRYFHQLPKSE